MTVKPIGHRSFVDGVKRPLFEDERSQFIGEVGERIEGVWLVPDEDLVVDAPLIVESRQRQTQTADLSGEKPFRSRRQRFLRSM